MGKILEQAKKDAIKFLKTGGFEVEATISNPQGLEPILITGLHTKHHISFDENGSRISSKNAHFLVSEIELNALGYVTRNERTGNVKMIDHLINCPDSTGNIRSYIINECYPDETLGLLLFILGDYKSS